MTNEKLLKYLSVLKTDVSGNINTTIHRVRPENYLRVIDEVIKALEQQPCEDVLDKIRAEIIQVANEEKVHDEKWALGLRYAVNIIDKYKAESEGVE